MTFEFFGCFPKEANSQIMNIGLEGGNIFLSPPFARVFSREVLIGVHGKKESVVIGLVAPSPHHGIDLQYLPSHI